MNGMHGIIFSYEKRNDLRELGEIRSASSIPFGGRYRAVDFALSNLTNVGVYTLKGAHIKQVLQVQFMGLYKVVL